MNPKPRCLTYPGRTFVRHCKCASCMACKAENKMNKRLRDARVAEYRANMAKRGLDVDGSPLKGIR